MAVRDYVVLCKPCQDTLACEGILALGFETHLLTVREEIRTHKRCETVETPLFPGYVFFKADLSVDNWRPIAYVRGVRRIFGADGERPTAMPVGALDGLRRRFEAGEFVKRRPEPIAPGEAVNIGDGAYNGRAGVCDMSRGDRVRVLMNVLGGEAKVWMPADWVTRAVTA